jgi:hypothetical protein
VRHRPLGRFLSAIFGVLALAAWSEVILVFFGSENPPTLVSLQLSIGLAAVATSWGSWRRARWAPIAAIAYGILTAILLLALPHFSSCPLNRALGSAPAPPRSHSSRFSAPPTSDPTLDGAPNRSRPSGLTDALAYELYARAQGEPVESADGALP